MKGSGGRKIDAFSNSQRRWMPIVEHVLSHYPQAGRATPIRCLGASGGFSGAHVWQLSTAQGTACLRGWPPEAVEPGRLIWIHGVLSRITQAGCTLVPPPWPTRSGATYVAFDARLWDLSPWMDGEADYGRAPSREKLVAAMHAVACLHRAAREAADQRTAGVGAAPSLARRLAFCQELDTGLWQELRARHARRARSAD